MNLNTTENRKAILDAISRDGVRLQDFNDAQKREIIKTYAVQVLSK